MITIVDTKIIWVRGSLSKVMIGTDPVGVKKFFLEDVVGLTELEEGRYNEMIKISVKYATKGKGYGFKIKEGLRPIGGGNCFDQVKDLLGTNWNLHYYPRTSKWSLVNAGNYVDSLEFTNTRTLREFLEQG